MIKKNGALIIVSLAMLMESVDATVLNTAIPVMAKSFKVHPVDLKLALITYLLSLAIFIPISGWIADKYGIKRVFLSAFALFTLSSLWCGFTQGLNELIIARIIQGIGGSLTVPLGRLVILRTYARHELISKMSTVVMVASIGMMLGPLLGGLIVTHVSWRWIFWVNVPIGSLAVCLGLKILPFMAQRTPPPLDKIGFVLFGSGLALLTYSLSSFSESTIPLRQSLLFLSLAVGLLIAYTYHSKDKKYPIIKVDLLSIRTFQISVLGNLLTRIGFGGLPFLLPLLLQLIFGYSPQLAGFLIMPIALGVITIKPLSIFILRILGFKKLLILNISLIGCVLFLFAMITPSTSVYKIGFLTYAYGLLVALQYTGMNSLAYSNLSDEDASPATSIMSTIQQLSLSFGVALAAILLSFYNYETTGHLILSLTTFQYTFITLSILSFLSALVFFRIRAEDGQELIARTH